MNLRTMQLAKRWPHRNTGSASAGAGGPRHQSPVPGILITGHDLLDLKNLLEQTAGKGINVYTHGEMLPGHMWLRTAGLPHFAGRFGGPWQNQRTDFENFWRSHLGDHQLRHYSARSQHLSRPAIHPAQHRSSWGQGDRRSRLHPIIEHALRIGSLDPTPIEQLQPGYHYTTVLSIADKVVDAVKSGQVKRFFVIGGCDGAEQGRNYYTEFAHSARKSRSS